MAEDEEAVLFEFVGRKEFLQDLQTQWGKYRIFGIFGLKSVGKSRTVNQFLKQFKLGHPNPETIQHIYVKLHSVSSWQGLALQIKSAFKDSNMNEDVDIFPKEVLRKMEECPDVNYILDFDDVEDVIESRVKDVFVSLCEHLIENCLRVKIVVTSTVRIKFPRQMNCYFGIELPVMSHQDGVELLRSVTPDVQYGHFIDKIVQLCLGLPLAILMTGSELKMDDTFLTPEDMVELLTKSRLEAWGRDESYSRDEQLGPVYRNFISRLSAIFQQRLSILGYIPGSFTLRHAQKMLGAQSTCAAKQETLSPLMKRHMVEFDAPKLRYNIHGILKLCLEDFLTVENLPEIRKRFCLIFSGVMQDLARKLSTRDCVEAISELATEHPNLQKLMLDVAYSNQETYPVYIKMVESSSNVIEQYFGGESFVFYTKCLELCQMYKKDKDDAIVSGAYGRSLTNVKGDLSTGEKMYSRALRVAKSDSYLAMAAQLYQNLGWNLHMQGKKEEALVSLKESQRLQEHLGMKNEPVVLSTLSVLGIVHTAIGNYEEGEKYHMESLKRRIAKVGENHPHIGACYNNLGILYLQKGDYSKSNYYYRKGLEIKRETNAAPSAIIISISNVVSVETMAKNYTAAKQLLDEGAAILTKELPAHGFEKGLILEGYGRLYINMGDYNQAVRVLKETVDLKRNSVIGGVGHVESLLTLGQAHRKAGNMREAWQVFQEALTHKESVASLMPQNRFIWACVVEMVEMLTEDGFSSENNSPDLDQLISYGRDELMRVISHYTEKQVFEMRDTYDKKLKEWNSKWKQGKVIYNRKQI